MELKQLEHFIAVVEEGSITRAAKRMNIVQSGLSMSIRTLEDELGTRLFERNARGAELTEAGVAMLPEARRAVDAVRTAREAVGSAQGVLRGTLSVGIAQSDGERIPRLLNRFHTAHPAVELRATQGTPVSLIESVEAGRLDLVIAGKPLRIPASITCVQLLHAPFVLMCAGTHPLAECTQVTLAEVAGEPFIELHPGWATRQHTDQAFEAAGLTRNVVCELEDIVLRVQMVAAGLGVAILPATRIPGAETLAQVPLHPELPPWQLVAAFKGTEPPSAAASVFLGMVKEEWSKP
jgi:DNA-binding transcriptional LysR family regulator